MKLGQQYRRSQRPDASSRKKRSDVAMFVLDTDPPLLEGHLYLAAYLEWKRTL